MHVPHCVRHWLAVRASGKEALKKLIHAAWELSGLWLKVHSGCALTVRPNQHYSGQYISASPSLCAPLVSCARQLLWKQYKQQNIWDRGLEDLGQ